MTERIKLTDLELLYAATARCKCGAGLAHPLDHGLAMSLGAWVCSAVLKHEVEGKAHTPEIFATQVTEGEHDAFPWAFYKIREETSVNNDGGRSTRPPGTVAMTICKAECPRCRHKWESAPFKAAGHRLQHSGPCPECGYAVGANGSWSSSEGDAIKCGFPDVILPSP